MKISLLIFSLVYSTISFAIAKTEVVCSDDGWNAATLRNYSIGSKIDQQIPSGTYRAFIVEGYTTHLLDKCVTYEASVMCTSSIDNRLLSVFDLKEISYQAYVKTPDYGERTYTVCNSTFLN